MPTYDYECEKCGHHFEKFQSMSDDPVKTCPKCKGRVKRLIGTGAGLLFKGEGFYITDYRSKGYQEKAKSDKAAEGGSSGSSGSSDSGSSGGAKEGASAGAKGSDSGGASGSPDQGKGTTSKAGKSSGSSPAKSPSTSKKSRSGGSDKSSN